MHCLIFWKFELLLLHGDLNMNVFCIHGYMKWSADHFGVEEPATCKICFLAGRAKAASCRTRHYSVPVGRAMLCPVCSSVKWLGTASMMS
jgi:hypothetical protein